MQEQDIITFLALVGDELQALEVQQPVQLLLIGGAYMLTQVHNRQATNDVDVIVQGLNPDTEAYRLFKAAVGFVAQDLGTSSAWLSDNMGQFFQSIGNVPRGNIWLSQGMLEVSVPEPHYILALKLLAGRDKDLHDIEALCATLGIKKRKQAEAVLKRYFAKKTLTDYAQDLHITLSSFFV